MSRNDLTPQLSLASDRVAMIELHRPRVANRIQPEDLEILEHFLDECERNNQIHVLVIAAIGSCFSAGFDLRALTADLDSSKHATERGDTVFEHFVDRLESTRLIVIAAINGPVLGGATDLALACDLRIGTADAYMQMPAARFGLPLYAGALQRYVSRLGLNHAKRLIFLAQKIAATEMLAIGFLNEIATASELRARTLELAQTIADMPSQPLAAMKRVLNASALGLGTATEQRQALIAAFDGPAIATRIKAAQSKKNSGE